MSTLNRRKFLSRSKKTALGVAAGWTILDNAESARGASANETVVLAAVGVRGRGSHLAQGCCPKSGPQLLSLGQLELFVLAKIVLPRMALSMNFCVELRLTKCVVFRRNASVG